MQQKLVENRPPSTSSKTTLSTLRNRYITPQNQLIGVDSNGIDRVDTTAINDDSADESSHFDAIPETRLARPKRKASANVSFEDQGEEIDSLLDADTEAFGREMAERKRVKLETFDDSSLSIAPETEGKSDREAAATEEASTTESTPVPEAPRRRGRPKKGQERTKVKLEVLRRSQRAVDRPQKYAEDPKKPAVSRKSAEARLVTPRPREVKEPLALYKTKRGERQKPFVVDTERFYHGNQRDRRLRINTLDVLRQVVADFIPSHRRSSSKGQDFGERYRAELLAYLEELSDTHASIKTISQDIADIQKQKNDLRSKIYDLRNDHVKVGNELNQLRTAYNTCKKHYDDFSVLSNHFEALSGSINSDEPAKTAALLPLVDSSIYKVSRLINPHSGVHKKLILINDKLQRLHEEIS